MRPNRRTRATSFLGLEARLLIAGPYLGALIGLAVWAHRGWPPATGAGLWFYSAALTVLLSIFVSEPFYTSPKAALTNSAALFLVVLTADRDGLQASSNAIAVGRIGLLVVAAIVFLAAAAAITTEARAPKLNAIAFPIAITFGAGYLLYGLTYIASVYGAFAQSPSRLAVLLAAALLFQWAPLERLESISRKIRTFQSTTTFVIREVEDPATAITIGPPNGVRVGQRLREPGGAIGVVVDATSTAVSQWARVAFPPDTLLRTAARLEADDDVGDPDEPDEPVVGYVASGSAINSIRVTSATNATDLDVEEGRLLAAQVRGKEVLFQITSASLQDDHLGPQGRVRFRIDAQKLGSWNDATHAFDVVPWLPDPWTPATLKTRLDADFDPDGIGFVPGSRYSIRYQPVAAVTHNTAILGILGSGKTTLARELICRNIDAGVKVLVLDITNQYSGFFEPLVPSTELTTRTTTINNATAVHHGHHTQDIDGVSFGSRGEFIRQMDADVKEFLDGRDQLRIYNPMAYNATTIDGTFRQGNNAQSLRELSVVEKTAYIAHAVLKGTMQLGETADARVCLVIEEGHSLVPEPYDGLNNDDKRAVIMTARAVLQGRKYGYGSILITQRTANVTKTILNQCHTVFALRSYDATGMAFLANYLGDTYSQLLSSMPVHHCVAFGQGITCSAPVVLQLNDPNDFDDGFWNGRLPQLCSDRIVPSPAEPAAVVEDPDDDIPF